MIWNEKCTEEIKSRVTMGNAGYEKVQGLLTAKIITIKLRKRFAKYFIWSVVLYGSELWTVKAC